MNETDNKSRVIDAAISELNNPTFAVTESYLEIHQVVKEKNSYKVVSVNFDPENKLAKVYFQVEGEKFYLVIVLETGSGIEMAGAYTEPWSYIFFRATSETLSIDDIKSMTTLEPTESYNIGDERRGYKRPFPFSDFRICIDSGPGDVEDKLSDILTILERDVKGVQKLADECEGYIRVAMDFHDGNGDLGGFDINQETIDRISELGVLMSFGFYCSGNPFK